MDVMSPGIELGTSRTEGRALLNCATLALTGFVIIFSHLLIAPSTWKF